MLKHVNSLLLQVVRHCEETEMEGNEVAVTAGKWILNSIEMRVAGLGNFTFVFLDKLKEMKVFGDYRNGE